jgi:hypothetical protein
MLSSNPVPWLEYAHWAFGILGDVCTLIGSIVIAKDALFKRENEVRLRTVIKGLESLLKPEEPLLIDGVLVTKPEDIVLVELKRLGAIARLGALWLVIGFTLQLITWGTEIALRYCG